MRDAQLKSCERQNRMAFDSNCSVDLFAHAYSLLQENWREGAPLRSLGVSVSSLSPADAILQLSFLPDDARRQKHQMLEQAIDDIRERYGHFAIQRAIMLSDRPLGDINPEEEHVLTPGYTYQ
jgi:DNA polymerase-4